MIRRIISAFLTAATLFLLPIAGYSSSPEPEIVFGSAEVSARVRTFTLPITLDNISGEFQLSGKIVYSPGVSLSAFFEGDAEEGEDGMLSQAFAIHGTANEEGSAVIKLPFVFADTVGIGDEFSVSFPEEILLTREGADPVSYFTDSVGVITATDEIIYGDANMDGSINVIDAINIVQRQAGYTIEIDVLCADINLDDSVNVRDAISIVQYISGWQTIRLGHQDKTEIITEATCQSAGEIRLTCAKCGDSKTVPTPKGDHSYTAGVCNICGQKSKNYPMLAYCDYLKKKAIYDDNLRGFAFYTTHKYDGYRVFVSNIYDDDAESLCLFATAYFDNGLTATLTIDIPSVSSGGTYSAYYTCSLASGVLASFTGNAGSCADAVTITSFTGDESTSESHINIASVMSRECFVYMQEILNGAGIDVTVEDFGIRF